MIHPDPLEFVLRYPDPLDQEIVGLIASSFAVGRVSSILAALDSILSRLGPPRRTIIESAPGDFTSLFDGFTYRFYRAEHLAGLLCGMRDVLKRHGTLERCFARSLSVSGGSMLGALDEFVAEIQWSSNSEARMLPTPSRGSGCKRLHLFMRWMVRRDTVDPGPWKTISPTILMMPVDVHVHRLARTVGITTRKAADARTCEEITEFFRTIAPHDPVRYDFALSRLGIRPELSYRRLTDAAEKCAAIHRSGRDGPIAPERPEGVSPE